METDIGLHLLNLMDWERGRRVVALRCRARRLVWCEETLRARCGRRRREVLRGLRVAAANRPESSVLVNKIIVYMLTSIGY